MPVSGVPGGLFVRSVCAEITRCGAAGGRPAGLRCGQSAVNRMYVASVAHVHLVYVPSRGGSKTMKKQEEYARRLSVEFVLRDLRECIQRCMQPCAQLPHLCTHNAGEAAERRDAERARLVRQIRKLCSTNVSLLVLEGPRAEIVQGVSR